MNDSFRTAASKIKDLESLRQICALARGAGKTRSN